MEATTPPAAIATRVIAWQRRHGRNQLPWQGQRDPYRVWLSEVMLQQTQVATVLGYYTRFLERLPDVAALAAASEDEVLALWSGLGYYSRARNLHACAQAVLREHGGRFPTTSTELERLPGIGRSTAAAIAAFCYGERAAILDGNVKRVLTRLLGFDADLAVAANQRALWAHAQALLPEAGIEVYTQGLMDLGASVCSARAPQCAACPLQAVCVAAQQGDPDRYPVKRRNALRGRREHVWLLLEWRAQVWLLRRPSSGIWAGLWSLPEFEPGAAFDDATKGWPGSGSALPGFRHVLTHLDWWLHPVRWTLPEAASEAQLAALVARWPEGRWMTRPQALASGLPAPLRTLLSTPPLS
ncbi:MAG: A/G-specific adenine glycosylase [Burkholderiaceae bacterium]